LIWRKFQERRFILKKTVSADILNLTTIHFFLILFYMKIESKAKTIGQWSVDLGNRTCSNIEYQMVIAFEKKGPALIGRIIDMPLKLYRTWLDDPNANNSIRKLFIEADEVFFREYFNDYIRNEDARHNQPVGSAGYLRC
jgi:hypothetical protein